VDIDTLWRLTGGDPRALHVIAVQGVERRFKEEILENVRISIETPWRYLGMERSRRELDAAACNIDDDSVSLLRSTLRRNVSSRGSLLF